MIFSVQVPQKPEDTFNFELIDIDESLKPLAISASGEVPPPQHDSLETPKRKSSLDKKVIGSDNYVSTVLSKSLDVNSSSPNEIVSDGHAILENRDSQSSASTYSSSLDGNSEYETNNNVNLKPHKPLTRQLSGKSTHEVIISNYIFMLGIIIHMYALW